MNGSAAVRPNTRPSPRRCAVRDQQLAKVLRQRNHAVAGFGLDLDLTFDVIPGPADVNDGGFGVEVDVGPAESPQLATAEPPVNCDRPERPFAVRERGDEPRGLGAIGDPLAPAPNGGEDETFRWVHRDLVALERATEDHTDRIERLAIVLADSPFLRSRST